MPTLHPEAGRLIENAEAQGRIQDFKRGGGGDGRPLGPNPNPNPKWWQTAKRGVTTTRHERELIFLSLFISISNKVTFRFFFTEKWGVDIHPIHPPCIRP